MENLTRAGVDASGDIDLMRRFMLKTSARNKLLGTVIQIREGAVNDEIVLRIAGGQAITAVITRESTQELGLAIGKEAIALVKASSVIVGAPGPGLRLSARNQLPGRISALRPGAVNSEIRIDLEGGVTLAAIVTNESANDLGLDVGADAVAIFKASSVILGVLD
jgi:molybdate transport system regulatory protein